MWLDDYSDAAAQPPVGSVAESRRDAACGKVDVSYEMYMPGSQSGLYQRAVNDASTVVSRVAVINPDRVINQPIGSTAELRAQRSNAPPPPPVFDASNRLLEANELATPVDAPTVATHNGEATSLARTQLAARASVYHRPMHVLDAPLSLHATKASPVNHAEGEVVHKDDGKPGPVVPLGVDATSSPQRKSDGALRGVASNSERDVDGPIGSDARRSPDRSLPDSVRPQAPLATAPTEQRDGGRKTMRAKPPAVTASDVATRSDGGATVPTKPFMSPKTARVVHQVAVHAAIALVTAAIVFVILMVINPSFVQGSTSVATWNEDDDVSGAAYMREPANVGKAAAISVFAGVAAAALPHAWKAIRPHVASMKSLGRL